MFDLIVSPKYAEKRPGMIILFSLALGILSSWLAIAVGQGYEVGHLIIAFICIGGAPLIVHMIWVEEAREVKEKFMERHWTLIAAYASFFVGIILATSLVYILLPENVAQATFAPQIHELHSIRTLATGHTVSNCGFSCILGNNLQVLLFVLIFSFLYGAGAIYIITWNASIIGVLVGITTEQLSNKFFGESIAYIPSLVISLFRLFPHGIFEITGYLIGGLAGGILSASILRGHITHKKIIVDLLSMISISILLIVIGAAVESMS